jgi:hypothetical protein
MGMTARSSAPPVARQAQQAPGPVVGQIRASPRPMMDAPSARLQHTLGNQQLQRLLDQTRAAGSRAADPSGPVTLRRCPCGGTAGASGECDECRRRRLELQRASAGAARESDAGSSIVPPIVHQVLGASGVPLASDVRADMEARFGHEFADVRVHTDAAAQSSARAVAARAYTVGRDIVFAAGEYAPSTFLGRHLLAHELAHVIQQRTAAVSSAALAVAPAHDPTETDAERAAEAATVDGVLARVAASSTTRRLSRRQAVRPPVVRPPVVEPRVEPREGEREPFGRERHLERYREPRPGDNSLEAVLQRMANERRRRHDLMEAQRPRVTLARGGSPPSFITDEGERLGMFEWGNARYRERAFHILDKIEWETERVPDDEALARVYRQWVVWEPGEERRPIIAPIFTPDDPVYPENFDAGFTQRIEAYARGAAKRRSRAKPKAAPKAEPEPQAGPRVGPKSALRGAEGEERQRHPGAYPICWPKPLLPPPEYRTGVKQNVFTRIKRAERDLDSAEQHRLQLRYREEVDPGFNAKDYHVHHIIPLFLGGPDWLMVNGIAWPRYAHLDGHTELRYQRQLKDPRVTAPLPPIGVDLYGEDHEAGTAYYLAGDKGTGTICRGS